jgi:hypothetical protein
MNKFSPSILSGKTAFFNHPNYQINLKNEFNSKEGTCIYKCSQIPKKNITPLLSYPLKKLLKWTLIPTVGQPQKFGSTLSREGNLWKYKRITLPIGDLKIDAAIMGRPSTLNNKKWVLLSLGRLERYEDIMKSSSLKKFLEKINANALFFNYPKVGASKGPRNAQNMTAAYKGMLEFLEDKKNGIGATKIIGYGYSMGGGVQGKSLESYPLQGKNIKYLFIKDRTFSSLQRTVHSLTKGFVGESLLSLGWDLDSTKSSYKLSHLQIPEIITQTTDINETPNSDGVISKNSSLMHSILNFSLSHKWYIGIPNHKEENLHSAPEVRFSETLAKKVNSLI